MAALEVQAPLMAAAPMFSPPIQATGTSTATALPPGWRSQLDLASGKMFYIDPFGQTHWDIPQQFSPPPLSTAPAAPEEDQQEDQQEDLPQLQSRVAGLAVR